jgi:hypothetical protein
VADRGEREGRSGGASVRHGPEDAARHASRKERALPLSAPAPLG